MKIIEANEGQKISYSTTKTWLNVGDQIMLNLKKYEADNDVHIDITSDMAGNLETGVGLLYVAQVDIPARAYTEEEIPNPDYSEETENNYQARSGSVLYGQRDLDTVRAERRCNL